VVQPYSPSTLERIGESRIDRGGGIQGDTHRRGGGYRGISIEREGDSLPW